MSFTTFIPISNPYQCLDPDGATLTPSASAAHVSHPIPSIPTLIFGGVPFHYIYMYLDLSSLACVTSTCHTWYQHISKHLSIKLPSYTQWNRFVATWLELKDVFTCHSNIAKPRMIETHEILQSPHNLFPSSSSSIDDLISSSPSTSTSTYPPAFAFHHQWRESMIRHIWSSSIPNITFPSLISEYNALYEWYGLWQTDISHDEMRYRPSIYDYEPQISVNTSMYLLLLPRCDDHNIPVGCGRFYQITDAVARTGIWCVGPSSDQHMLRLLYETVTSLSDGNDVSEIYPCDTLAIVPSPTATVNHPWPILVYNADPMDHWARSLHKLYRYHTPHRIPSTALDLAHVDPLLTSLTHPFIGCLLHHTNDWIHHYCYYNYHYHDPDYEMTPSELSDRFGHGSPAEWNNDRTIWLEETWKRQKQAGEQKQMSKIKGWRRHGTNRKTGCTCRGGDRRGLRRKKHPTIKQRRRIRERILDVTCTSA